MSSIQTTITIEQTLHEEVKVTAKELHLSRSKLYSLAVEHFLRRYKSLKLRENLDTVYRNDLFTEDELFQEQIEEELEKLWVGETRALLETINEAYWDSQEEELAVSEKMRQHQLDLLADEPW